jgi:hypothetical protein
MVIFSLYGITWYACQGGVSLSKFSGGYLDTLFGGVISSPTALW